MDLNKLEALARTATPGPWTATREFANRWFISPEPTSFYPVASVYGHGDVSLIEANAEYLAAANPATVLELIALVRRQEAELAAERRNDASHNRTIKMLLDRLDALGDGAPANDAASLPAAGVRTDEQIALAQCFRAAFDTPIARRKLDAGEAGEFCRHHFRAILAAQPAPSAAPIPAQPVVKIGYMKGHYEAGMQAEIIEGANVHDGMLLYTAPGQASAPDEQAEPLAVLTLGGIDGDEYDAWDIEVVSSKAIEELQEQLVKTSEPVILNLYPSLPAPAAAQPEAKAAPAPEGVQP